MNKGLLKDQFKKYIECILSNNNPSFNIENILLLFQNDLRIDWIIELIEKSYAGGINTIKRMGCYVNLLNTILMYGCRFSDVRCYLGDDITSTVFELLDTYKRRPAFIDELQKIKIRQAGIDI